MSTEPQTPAELKEWRKKLAAALCEKCQGISHHFVEAVCEGVTPAPNGFTIEGQFYHGKPSYWLKQYLDASLSQRLSYFVGRAQTL